MALIIIAYANVIQFCNQFIEYLLEHATRIKAVHFIHTNVLIDEFKDLNKR